MSESPEDGTQIQTAVEMVKEAARLFENAINAVVDEARSLAGVTDDTVTIIEHSTRPETIRGFFAQGPERYAWFFVALGFEPNTNEFHFFVSDIEVSEGQIPQDTPLTDSPKSDSIDETD